MAITAASDVRTVSVLGSTGSVGTSTVDLLAMNPDRFRVRVLVGGRNAGLLAEQARLLRADYAVIAETAHHAALEAALAGTGIQIASGNTAVLQAAALPVDWTMAAITGAAGLPSTLAPSTMRSFRRWRRATAARSSGSC